MNEHPKVSIVVPAYNAAGYIEGCVNSVLTQSCGSFELIIVNDGSKDDTAAVVSAVAEKDSRVRLLTVENGGPAAALVRNLIRRQDAQQVFIRDLDRLYAGAVSKIQPHARPPKRCAAPRSAFTTGSSSPVRKRISAPPPVQT